MLSLALLLAMQTTTTNCIPLGGQINCTSTTPQPYQAPPPMTQVDVRGAIGAYERGRQARQQYEAPPPEDDPVENPFRVELSRRMGILYRQGRCEDAFRLAALASEPELADASRRLCPF